MKILFVCMGNICRSPMAEGVFKHHVKQAGLDGRISTDSAGTHDYHVGEPPDPRAQRAAKRRGYDLSVLRARQAVEPISNEPLVQIETQPSGPATAGTEQKENTLPG